MVTVVSDGTDVVSGGTDENGVWSLIGQLRMMCGL